MKYFVCIEFVKGSNNCSRWTELTPEMITTFAPVEQNTFISELANLSFSNAQALLSFTAALFASAWVWRILSKQAFR